MRKRRSIPIAKARLCYTTHKVFCLWRNPVWTQTSGFVCILSDTIRKTILSPLSPRDKRPIAIVIGSSLLHLYQDIAVDILSDYDIEYDIFVSNHHVSLCGWRIRASSVLPSFVFHSVHPFAGRPMRTIAAILGDLNR